METDLEMNFAEGLAAKLLRIGIPVPQKPPHRCFPDDLGTFLRLRRNDDPIRSVNLKIRENSILQHEPPRPPTFTVIHPLIQYPGDAISNDVVYLDIDRLLPRNRRPGHNLGRGDGCSSRSRRRPLA